MALILAGLPQVAQIGDSLWFTDKTGEHDATTNEGGWGAPNVELDQSAILVFVYRMTNPTFQLLPIGSTIKHNPVATNADELAFQFTYNNDGYHQFNSVRMMVSSDDANSIDTVPIVFTNGDVWYNSTDGLVKQMQGGSPVVLDITDQTDLSTILASDSVVQLLCEQVYYVNLAIKKNDLYNSMREARRRENTSQVNRDKEDQMDILLGTASAAYNFSFGLKTEAQDIIESLLDDFKLA